MEQRDSRLRGIERRHHDGRLNDGTARSDAEGDAGNANAQQTGKSGAEPHLEGAGEVRGIACDGKGGRDDEHTRPAGWGGWR